MMATGAGASPLMVCDFEDYAIGTQVPMWNVYGSAVTSTATVEADPNDAGNKVLHVVLKEWCTHPEFVLPTTLRGSALTARYGKVRYRLYRSSADADEWKQFAAFIGSQEVYRDEGYPSQGAQCVWQAKEYSLSAVEDGNESAILRLGIHHNNSDYYIDDVQLVGEFDDYVTVEDGGVLDYCVNNTSSSYKAISDDIYIPAGQTANVRTSRYSEWTGRVTGEGTLNIHAGGERSYMGTLASKGATYPDWSGMKGSVHVYPYKDVIGTCGFYGIILNSGTFQPDNIDASNYNALFADKALVLHDGATMAVESGTRGIRIGELQTEAGSVLGGYYKSSTATSYYVVGCRNTDAELAGAIRTIATGNKVGLIKEGTGTYSITGCDNDISGGIRVLAGTLLADNDAAATLAARQGGATGSSGTLAVFRGATLGGCGTIAAPTEVYGTVRPGTADVGGTLQFVNAAAPETGVRLTLHPEANVVCTVQGAGDGSVLSVSGTLAYSGKTQDFEDSGQMPRLTIALQEGAQLAVGDEVTLLTAAAKEGDEWAFSFRYPKAYTWVVEQREGTDGSYNIVAKVTSLDYSGQGDVEDEDGNGGGTGAYPDDDWTYDLTDDTPLRTYAEKLGKDIGVAAASYRYDLSLDTGETGLVGKQFTMLVGENEMKFDATEPAQNAFSYSGADAIMWVADRYAQEVRGHTLAWHSQVPAWVSQDGKKNDKGYTREQLLDILKNHIYNVVGNYRGRIREWDVCNEVLDDDQSIVRTDPTAYKLRPSIWATYIGEEFIDSAFVWAHQADPEAKLYINEYGAEFMGGTKSEAYYNLVKRLKESGRPIDGCGLQCHLTTGELDTLKLEKNIRRYADIGMNCIITELDIALANPYAADALDVQAKEYGAITRIFLRNDNCPSMLVWGISDNHSWRQNQPLLYNSALEPKPAYYNVHAQLRLAAERYTAVDRVGADATGATVVGRTYTNVAGQQLAKPAGLVIETLRYSDGTVRSVKKLYR